MNTIEALRAKFVEAKFSYPMQWYRRRTGNAALQRNDSW